MSDGPISFCTNCGARLEPDAHFCGECGHARSGEASGPPASPPPTQPTPPLSSSDATAPPSAGGQAQPGSGSRTTLIVVGVAAALVLIVSLVVIAVVLVSDDSSGGDVSTTTTSTSSTSTTSTSTTTTGAPATGDASGTAIGIVQGALSQCGQGGSLGEISAAETDPGVYLVTVPVTFEGFEDEPPILAGWIVDLDADPPAPVPQDQSAAELICQG